MGEMDRIVGTTRYVKARPSMIPETRNIPDVGRGFMPDLETLSLLEPDLVITWAANPGPELEKRLGPMGIAVLRLDFFHPVIFSREVTTLAEVLGGNAPLRAKKYLLWINEREERIGKLIRDSKREKPTVMIEHFTERRLAGPGSGAHELSILSGAENLAGILGKQSLTVEDEWVIRQNPEYFIKIVSPPIAVSDEEREKVMKDAINEVMERPGWDGIRAVKNKKVFALDSDFSGGPRYIVGLCQLAHIFYPDLISEKEAEDAFREYLEDFHGMDPNERNIS